MVFILPRATSLGLYARKNALPTLTINDIRDVLTGQVNTGLELAQQSQRTTRSVVSLILFQYENKVYYTLRAFWHKILGFRVFASFYNQGKYSKNDVKMWKPEKIDLKT